jgi:hypothetical protein
VLVIFFRGRIFVVFFFLFLFARYFGSSLLFLNGSPRSRLCCLNLDQMWCLVGDLRSRRRHQCLLGHSLLCRTRPPRIIRRVLSCAVGTRTRALLRPLSLLHPSILHIFDCLLATSAVSRATHSESDLLRAPCFVLSNPQRQLNFLLVQILLQRPLARVRALGPLVLTLQAGRRRSPDTRLTHCCQALRDRWTDVMLRLIAGRCCSRCTCSCAGELSSRLPGRRISVSFSWLRLRPCCLCAESCATTACWRAILGKLRPLLWLRGRMIRACLLLRAVCRRACWVSG